MSESMTCIGYVPPDISVILICTILYYCWSYVGVIVGVGVTLGQIDVHGILSGIEIPLFGNEISTQTTKYKVVPD